ncbi:MAG: PDZ domain-containing protein [Phycisphaerales bacterium]|nr:PDZ domain-containing protein [Phycisphaerales bacterium]
MSRRIATRIILAAFAVLLSCSPLALRSADQSGQAPPASEAATTETAPPQPSGTTSLIKALRSDQFHVREQASTKLLRLPPERLSEIEHALASETDAEAIARLTTVALHLYLKNPQITPLQGKAGLLGISLSVEPRGTRGDMEEGEQKVDPQARAGGGAIVVIDIKPGFPAYEVLKPGDRILAIDDKPLTLGYSVDAFREKVSATMPGSFIPMTLLRGGKKINAQVQIAGLDRKGDDFILDFIEKRTRLANSYLSQLRIGQKPPTLTFHDNTLPEANIYNDFEFDPP